MKPAQFADFSQLYRAAYAEADQERKMLLLSEVRKAIDQRMQETGVEASQAAKAA